MAEIYEKLGLAIRHQRKRLKLTQREVANYAGCGEAFLHLLEHGKPTVRLDKVVNVLKVLGLEFQLALGKRGIGIDGDEL